MMTGLLFEVVSAADSFLNNVSRHPFLYEKAGASGSALSFCDSFTGKGYRPCDSLQKPGSF